MKSLWLAAGIVVAGAMLTAPATAQRNFYCSEDIRAGDIFRAETGSIPGFVYGQTRGSAVNIRSNPSNVAEVVGTIRVGERVSLIARTHQVNWSEDLGAFCEAWYQIDRGWINGEFIRLADFVYE